MFLSILFIGSTRSSQEMPRPGNRGRGGRPLNFPPSAPGRGGDLSSPTRQSQEPSSFEKELSSQIFEVCIQISFKGKSTMLFIHLYIFSRDIFQNEPLEPHGKLF